MRDDYTPDDPDWREWREGHRFDPAQRWSDWFDLMRETTGHGVQIPIRCLKRYIAREIYHLIQQVNPIDQIPRTA
jgi:hypothetical protein